MPELRYLDNKYDALQSGANTLQGLAYQLPQLRIAAERLRQEQAMAEAHKILYGAQAQSELATAKLRDSQSRLNDNKLEDAKRTSQAIVNAGRARAQLYAQQRPPLMTVPGQSFVGMNGVYSTPPMMGPTIAAQQQDAVTGAMSNYIQNAMMIAGTRPQMGEQAIDRTMANVSADVVNNPRLAELIATGTKMAPWRAGPNTALYNPAHPEDQPMLGPAMIPRGGTYNFPGQPTIMGQPGGQGATLGFEEYNKRQRAQFITKWAAEHIGQDTTDEQLAEIIKKANKLYGTQSDTNGPAAPSDSNDPLGLRK